MKLIYEEPEIILIDFQTADQVTGSGGLGGAEGEGDIESGW